MEDLGDIINSRKTETEATEAADNIRRLFDDILSDDESGIYLPLCDDGSSRQRYITSSKVVPMLEVTKGAVLLGDGSIRSGRLTDRLDPDLLTPATDLDIVLYGPDLLIELCESTLASLENYKDASKVKHYLDFLDSRQNNEIFLNAVEAQKHIRRGGFKSPEFSRAYYEQLASVRAAYELFIRIDEIRDALTDEAERLSYAGLSDIIKKLVVEYIKPNRLFPTSVNQKKGQTRWYPQRDPYCQDAWRISSGLDNQWWSISENGEIGYHGYDNITKYDFDEVKYLSEIPHVIGDLFLPAVIKKVLPKIGSETEEVPF